MAITPNKIPKRNQRGLLYKNLPIYVITNEAVFGVAPPPPPPTRPWVPTDMANLALWIDPADLTSWFEEEVASGLGELNSADLSAFIPDYTGFFPGVGGSFTGQLVPGADTYYFIETGNAVSISLTGDHVAALTGLTHVKINGTDVPITVPPSFSGGATGFDCGPYNLGVGLFDVELVGVSSGTVTQYSILDKSGNNNSFAQVAKNLVNSRTVNGKKAMDFSGDPVDRLLSQTTGLNNIPNANSSTFIAAGADNASQHYVAFGFIKADLGYVHFLARNQTNGFWSYNLGGYGSHGFWNNGAISSTPIVFGYVRNGANYTGWGNGSLDITSTGGAESFVATQLNISIGGANATTPLGFDGWIGDVIVYTTALSTDDRQIIEGYLAHKWNMTANLPGGHPYKTAAPTVLLEPSSGGRRFKSHFWI